MDGGYSEHQDQQVYHPPAPSQQFLPPVVQSIRTQFQHSEESRLFLQVVDSISLGERVEEAILPLILTNDLANVTLWRGSEIVISEWIESLKQTNKVSIGSYMALKRVQETRPTLRLSPRRVSEMQSCSLTAR